MSLESRRELAVTLASRYGSANKAEKRVMLDEFVKNAGYKSRKHAIVVLAKASITSGNARKERVRRTRRPKYGPDVAYVFVSIWRLSGGLCPKRLVPYLGEFIEALERFDEISLCPDVRAKLLTMSKATAERLLHRQRRTHARGISTTLPGALLRGQIPIRTFADWDERCPGYCEIDLVAHCGGTAVGEYLYTLTLTDVFTGWTECVTVLNRGQEAVVAGLEIIRRRLPFALLGIDSDNGKEFINYHLKRYCDAHNIKFTRCRAYKKNDQCHVEQKNGSVVRPLVGYARYEGAEAAAHLNRIYVKHRLCVNFFEPSMKLIEKIRTDKRLSRKWDEPKTPWHRLKESTTLSEDNRERLEQFYRSLNPAQLRRELADLDMDLRRHSVGEPLLTGALRASEAEGDTRG